jgi:hypothetical protein
MCALPDILQEPALGAAGGRMAPIRRCHGIAVATSVQQEDVMASIEQSIKRGRLS